jgi:thiol-disulfide isomerase/thioredoxin
MPCEYALTISFHRKLSLYTPAMLKLFLLISILAANCCSYCQIKKTARPFTIEGKLDNVSAGDMMFFFADPKTNYKTYVIETVKLDSAGRFFYETYSVTQPVTATLRKEFISINIYAAPGYKLKLTGDVSDVSKFQQHKKITGTGAAANSFLFRSDSISWYHSSTDTTQWTNLSLKQLVKFADTYERQRNKLQREIFQSGNKADKWLPSFSAISQTDTKALKLYYLISHLVNDTSLSYKQTVALLSKYADKEMLANIYDNKFIAAENYRGWLMGTYPYYLRELKARKSTGSRNEKEKDIQIIAAIADTYKNQIRETKLYVKLEQLITACRSFEELNLFKDKLPAYIKSLRDKNDRSALNALLASMDAALLTTQVGQVAPPFIARDSSGKSYSLDDFNGKVVYLDLWASWCIPCRQEIPYLKKQVEKYKDNNDIVFVSIGVLDDSLKWKKAVIEDQPSWLQLYDNKALVAKSYFTNSVPKYVLINKKGNIESFDAPFPSAGRELESLLQKVLSQ